MHPHTHTHKVFPLQIDSRSKMYCKPNTLIANATYFHQQMNKFTDVYKMVVTRLIQIYDT